MAAFTFENLVTEIQDIQEEGVEFVDKQLVWDTADDVKDVVEALNGKERLRYMKLDGNTLGVKAAEAIGKALERHSEFRKALWKNLFTGRLKSEIPQALKYLSNGMIVANAHLHTLDLSDNALGPNGMVGLDDLLRSSVCYTLKELYLNNCGLGIGGGQMLSNALIDCYDNCLSTGVEMSLEVLVIGRNRLENAGAAAIGRLLSTHCKLKELRMPQNSIYHEGAEFLSQGIKQNTELEILDLNDNIVTSKGAVYLAEAFAFTPHLREINFGDCLLKTDGALQFANALKNNHLELEVVNLSFNEIELDGALPLVGALHNKSKLVKLNLDGNRFGVIGCQSIQLAMKTCLNSDALESIEEDELIKEDEEEEDDLVSEGDKFEITEDYNEIEDDDDEEDGDHERAADLKFNHCNDTTQVVEEDEYDESAYVTSVGSNTKLFGANDSCVSNRSVSFAEPAATAAATIETFCLNQLPCSLQMFDSIPQRNLQDFLDFLEQFKDSDNYLLLLIFTTLKCAHLSKESPKALDLAVALYKATVDYAVETKQERRITNYLLKQLNLMRSEVKFTTKYNMTSCQYALREALKREALTNEYMRNTFQVFLDQLQST